MRKSGKAVNRPVDLFKNRYGGGKSKKIRRLFKPLSFLLILVIAFLGIRWSYLRIETSLDHGLILPIKHVYIRGTSNIPSNAIRKALYGRDASLLTLSRTRISRYLQRNNWFSSLTVVKRFPNTVILDIKERKPALLLICNNKKWLVDTKGYRFKQITTHSERYFLPSVYASSCFDLKSNYDLYSKLLFVRKQLGKFISVKRIDIIGKAIYYRAESGPVIVVPAHMNIKFIKKRINRLRSAWEHFSRKNEIGGIDKVSLVLKNQIVVQWNVKHGR